MKKNDLVLEIASRLGLPKVECEKVIDTFADVVTDALVEGDKVTIRVKNSSKLFRQIDFEIFNEKAESEKNEFIK